MDEVDHKLLALLTRDARRSATQLAKDLKVSRGTIQNRIDRLCDRGVIQRFTVQLGAGDVDHQISAFTLIRLKADDGQVAMSALKRIEGITDISTLSGEFDLVVELRCASLKQLDALLDKIRGIKDVAMTQSHLRLNTYSK